MTEQEWLTCTDPDAMLTFLRGKSSERKLRLFACSCCRRIWHLLTDERSRKGVEIAERYADGEASDEEMEVAFRAAWAVLTHCLGPQAAAAEAAAESTWGHDAFGPPYHLSLLTYSIFFAVGEDKSERIAQCRLLREVIGNPFLPPQPFLSATLTWNGGTVTQLARHIYDDRAFDRLPILADALEEAGCTDTDILNHCRQPGEHVRGCWLVDMLLGKS